MLYQTASRLPFACRSFAHSARSLRVFDDFVNVLDNAPRPAITVKSLDSRGFHFVDGLLVSSSCIFVNGSLFLWKTPAVPIDLRWQGWANDHFCLFEAAIPKPEILLIGTGKSVMPVAPHLRKYLNGLGIQVDTLDSWNACSTYNLLAEEGRRVAAAVMPLEA